MNFKKTIAGICALAMVGTCGVSVFAEDVTTTTTDVQDETTVTTVETEEMTDASAAMTEGTTTEESVTTGVTTEATEETTTETAVTDENVDLKASGLFKQATYEVDGVTITATLGSNDVSAPDNNIYLTISDGANSLEFCVASPDFGMIEISDFFEVSKKTIDGIDVNVLTIKCYSSADLYSETQYNYSKNDGFEKVVNGGEEDEPDVEQTMTFTFAGHTFTASKYCPNNDGHVLLNVCEVGSQIPAYEETIFRYPLFNEKDYANKDINEFVYVDGIENVLIVDSPIMGKKAYVYDETNKRLKLASSIDEPVEPIVTEEQLRKIFADFLAENGYEGNIISFYVGESGDLEARASYTKDSKSVSCTVTKDGVIDGKSSINVLNCKYFELNGVKFFAQLIGGSMNDGTGMGTRELTIYRLSSDGTYIATNLSNIILIDNLTGGSNQGDYSVIDNWIRVDGDKLSLCVSRNEGENNVFEVKTTYTWDKASNKFVTGILEKTFYVSIPYNYITIDGVSFPTANKSISDLTVTECTNGNIASIDRGCEVGDGICFVRGISVENVKPGELIINGKCSGYNTLDESHKLAGYTPFYDEGITHNFTIKVMVNEDGTISPYTEPKPNPDNNTDSKPSKKNPAGTGSSPKTGENAVLPVALALTFVAGTAVVAGIKKKKK